MQEWVFHPEAAVEKDGYVIRIKEVLADVNTFYVNVEVELTTLEARLRPEICLLESDPYHVAPEADSAICYVTADCTPAGYAPKSRFCIGMDNAGRVLNQVFQLDCTDP